ncbi:MAG: acyl-CoA thioesterase, partial [Clostridia bacterium]|nr:acyl-CoA thioesterase [Clostridia bacterium]
EAMVTWTGHTSLEVRVDSYVESLNGERTPINRTYVVYVALDDRERPVSIPPFVPETEEEKREYEAAKERRERRLARQTEMRR